MTRKLLIDTDVLVDFLRGFPAAVKYLKSHSEEIIISATAVAKLYAGVKDSQRGQLDDLISLFEVILEPACRRSAFGRAPMIFWSANAEGALF